MKCTIPEISWHNRDPVLSVDIQPTQEDKNDFQRLASGGTDSHVLIWYMKLNESGSINLDLAADLTRHQRAVNVVKWSPNGELLASGDDESVIFIWKLKSESEPLNIVDTTNEQDKEIWITLKILRGHMEDVYDLSWSPNSQFLVSGSVDNTAMIWDIHKGKSVSILSEHKGFVQGVAWDPQNQYIATLSTDRFLRIFDIQTKKVVRRSSKCTLPVPEGSELFGKTIRIFHDDTLQTFFRRLCFSPDGKLLITPAGITDYDGAAKPLHTTYIYSRYSLKQPSIVLPSPDQYTVAVKCCPKLFKLHPHNESNPPVVPLPYRMIFAVATKSSVYLYDTQQKMPFGIISNIHYTRLTDLTWSSDGRILIVSSTDGFCSLITFSENELGELYTENPEDEQSSNVNRPKLKYDHANIQGKNKLPEDSQERRKSVKKEVDLSGLEPGNQQRGELDEDEDVIIVDVEMKSVVPDNKENDQKHKPKTPGKSKGPNWIEVRRKPRTPPKKISKSESNKSPESLENQNKLVEGCEAADILVKKDSNSKTESVQREIIESKIIPFPNNSNTKLSKAPTWIEVRRKPRTPASENSKSANSTESISGRGENDAAKHLTTTEKDIEGISASPAVKTRDELKTIEDKINVNEENDNIKKSKDDADSEISTEKKISDENNKMNTEKEFNLPNDSESARGETEKDGKKESLDDTEPCKPLENKDFERQSNTVENAIEERKSSINQGSDIKKFTEPSQIKSSDNEESGKGDLGGTKTEPI